MATLAGASACVIGPKQDDPAAPGSAPDASPPGESDAAVSDEHETDATAGAFTDGGATGDTAVHDALGSQSEAGCAPADGGDAGDAAETSCNNGKDGGGSDARADG